MTGHVAIADMKTCNITCQNNPPFMSRNNKERKQAKNVHSFVFSVLDDSDFFMYKHCIHDNNVS